MNEHHFRFARSQNDLLRAARFEDETSELTNLMIAFLCGIASGLLLAYFGI